VFRIRAAASSRVREQLEAGKSGLSVLSLKYGAFERGEGLRTSCSIFWSVRQSAGVSKGRGVSLRDEGELILSSRGDGELMLFLLLL
jgi:hypothetical protein